MRAVLPLLIFALAGGDQFVDSSFPRERHEFEVSGKRYAVATQFDPIEWAYFNQITSAGVGPGLTAEDADAAVQIVEQEIGAIYCERTQRMELSRFNKDNLPGGGNVVFLESRGIYQIVGRCELPDLPSEAPDLPDFSGVSLFDS